MQRYAGKAYHMGRLNVDVDLLKGLEERVDALGIEAGYLWVLGALKQGTVGFFNQKERAYETIEILKPVEIVVCHGNISRKEGEVALHLHLSVADETGAVFGGHLEPGNRVFVAEYCIAEFSGEPLKRMHRPEMNLALWSADDETTK